MSGSAGSHARGVHVLVVDDDQHVRALVRRLLEQEGFVVLEAEDGPTCLATAAQHPVAIAIVDLHLTGMSGFDVLDRLRDRDDDIHIIILTAAGSEDDRVRGLLGGADDYVVKPFSPRELTARVLAAERRRAEPTDQMLDLPGLRIDTTSREVWAAGIPVSLTRREFALLHHLACHPERTFTHDELLDAVWGSAAGWQSPATVTEHIRRLRTKIELDPERPVRIVTVRGEGYRFHGEPPRRGRRQPAAISDPAADDVEPSLVLLGPTVVEVNPAALDLLGIRDASELIGEQAFSFVAPQSLDAAQERYEEAIRGVTPPPALAMIVRPDGEERLVEITHAHIRWEGEPAMRITARDLTDDTSRLRELAVGVRADETDPVLVTDVHLRIQSFNRAAEELYGWSEDEVIGRSSMEVIPWEQDDIAAEEIARAFQNHGRWHGEVVQRRRDGSSVRVHSSATLLRGLGGEPIGTVAVNRPIDRAGPQIVEPGARRSVDDREIRHGVETGQFLVHYQPIIRLDDSQVVGAEALVRWDHPERGLLTPDAFIAEAERSGAIVHLGHHVLDEACMQWSRWRASGHELHVAVNLSGRQLADTELPSLLRRAMAEARMPAGQLWLEVTETSLVQDLEQAAELLTEAEAIGARTAIDDFGTGWASLAYLHQFPIHSLKVDRMFVGGLGRDPRDTAIVSSVVRLAQELDLVTTAEGIETAEQQEQLVELGCDRGQGYLHGRPVPPDALLVG